jgi:group I intron endonuclease
MKCGIYKITNICKECEGLPCKSYGKVYIGKSKNIENRWSIYKKYPNKKEKKNNLLYMAIKKYGIENFSFEIIKLCLENHLNDLERFFIRVYYSYYKFGYGYNMTFGGDGGTIERTKECNEKANIKRKQTMSTPEYKAKFSEIMKGKRKGFIMTEESKKKISISKKGKSSAWNKGIPWSEEHKKLLKETPNLRFLGKNHSEESKKKISESLTGHIHSEETRKKISKNSRKFQTEETRKKIGEYSKKRKWWNNGIINKFCEFCPEDFIKGKIKK